MTHDKRALRLASITVDCLTQQQLGGTLYAGFFLAVALAKEGYIDMGTDSP
jgi:hypothetical protein